MTSIEKALKLGDASEAVRTNFDILVNLGFFTKKEAGEISDIFITAWHRQLDISTEDLFNDLRN